MSPEVRCFDNDDDRIEYGIMVEIMVKGSNIVGASVMVCTAPTQLERGYSTFLLSNVLAGAAFLPIYIHHCRNQDSTGRVNAQYLIFL